jgi:hypothetical protein
LEPRSGLGDDQVAVQHHAQAKSEHVAVHGGEDGFEINRLKQEVRGIRALTLRTAESLKFLTGAQLPLMYVRATAERSAAAAQDRDICIRIRIEATERRHQLAHDFVTDGIQLFRPVQRNRRDVILAFILDVLPLRFRCHWRLPWLLLPFGVA